MLSTFKSLASAVRLRVNVVRIDTPIFRLHYRFTFVILVACTILVTLRQYIGEHIACLHDLGKTFNEVINTYCFISTTFSVPELVEKAPGGEAEAAVRGLGPYDAETDDVTYHAYYQWVPFVLFAQAIMFYAPYAIWKASEGNKLRSIIQGLNLFCIKENDSDRRCKEHVLAEFLHNRWHEHNTYALKFFACELLNAVNVVGQIFLVDKFLGGEFRRYGLEVANFLELDPEQRYDPMYRVFPKITKCTFHKYGPSGTVQKHDAMCVLALNIINEKIYVFLWFWFVILASVTAADVLVRAALLAMPTLRTLALRFRLDADAKHYADDVVSRCQFGDYLLLDFLARNMDSHAFGHLMAQLSRGLRHGRLSLQSEEDTPILT